ncbi:hypothetical protein QQS21_008402 [Conoideocrella luteorostrata]|uniref:FmHP n=1 Tax=Conoideocrella luteorostrata TaxID=1105319 RepID=A0AAJ0CJT2_9HYPO|nr:hypothetical protein QQS21_008402 [Conoideocrella luteorostrata]
MDDSKPDAAQAAEAPAKELDAATQRQHQDPTVSPMTDGKESTTIAQNDATTSAVGTSTSPAAGSSAPPKSIEIDKSKPEDFDGEVATTNELPSEETIKKIENYTILDKDGKTRTFKSLYSGNNVARRVLVVFIRHFFCGNCQEYLRTFSESISPESLLQLPVSTFVVVVGCGDPALIDMYIEATKCPFPIYTDPTRSLFNELGMTMTLALGSRPAYMKKSMWKSSLDSIGQALRFVPKGLVLKSGDQRQVGGEFLFEPLDLVTPITTPQDERPMTMGSFQDPSSGGNAQVEEKKVTWCHRMKTTRDHAEIPELMEVLGLDGHGKPIEDQDRWSKALASRKGTGLSMASRMSKLSEANEPTKL